MGGEVGLSHVSRVGRRSHTRAVLYNTALSDASVVCKGSAAALTLGSSYILRFQRSAAGPALLALGHGSHGHSRLIISKWL